MNRLFYKHYRDTYLNNLGSYGSDFYYPIVNFYYNYSLVINENVTYKELFKLTGIKPFTNITYINASRKEQVFKINHFQQFGKQLTFLLDLNKISTPGSFINQEANRTNFFSEIDYHSKSKKYQITFNTDVNRYFNQENGGLFNSDDFINKRFDNERNYSVNLTSSNSYTKNYTFDLYQKLRLFNFSNDSLKENEISLSYDFSYNYSNSVFFDEDPQATIYQFNYLDTNKILTILQLDSIITLEDSTNFNYLNSLVMLPSIDSLHKKEIGNTVGIEFKIKTLTGKVFYQYDIKDYYQGFKIDTIQRFYDTSYVDNFIGLQTDLNFNKFKVQGIIKYGVFGYRQQDVLMDVKVSTNNKNNNYFIRGAYFLTEPDLKWINYHSNHFNWENNNFNKQAILLVDAQSRLKKFKFTIDASARLVNNALYFDTHSLPSQAKNQLIIANISIAKDYKFYKFYFRTAGIYQYTSDDLVAPLPQFVLRQVAYFEHKVFKKALKIQLGVGLSYNTAYYGYAYSPAIREFYVQNNKEIGNYPIIDIFLNTYLKRAQLFLKWEHFNAGRNNYRAFNSPNYPIIQRSLKFGISWNLFD